MDKPFNLINIPCPVHMLVHGLRYIELGSINEDYNSTNYRINLLDLEKKNLSTNMDKK